ncbi:MAG: 50S ribosomal protein L35 [Planctomycetes bacterium]|nr:50S ribosomal protein L35 [Planctomycetota bacterium]
MPKQKTKKSLRKRMWVTKNGKVRCYPAGTGHMQVSKSSKRRRKLRRSKILTGAIAKICRACIEL